MVFYCYVAGPCSFTPLFTRRDGKRGKKFCGRHCLPEKHRCFAQPQLKSSNWYLRGASFSSWVRELAKPLTVGKFYKNSSLRKKNKKLIYNSLPILSLIFFFCMCVKGFKSAPETDSYNSQKAKLFLFMEQRNKQSSQTPRICLYRREAYYNELINQLDIWFEIAVKREKKSLY